MLITDFHSLRPAFEISQGKAFEWLIDAHTEAEPTIDKEAFKQQIARKLHHVGCGPAAIEKRGHEIPLEKRPAGLKELLKVHQKSALSRFEEFFPLGAKAPDHLIHVTCTGYTSPSPSQILVANRGWNTTLTSCYHYGCYGSIPAVRLANAFQQHTEIVHTELCTLHFNPLNHDLDQLVGQTLFSDGFMKYSVLPKTEKPHLKLLRTQEKIIPDSSHAMEWLIKDWGFHFKLSKEIPTLIAANLKDFLKDLCEESLVPKALFAIHPGGPKIIDNIKNLLNLSDEQVTHSREILRKYGNMSSATLPHVWQAILNDSNIPIHTPIVSLAFGPGLTLAGSLSKKVC